MNRMLAAAAISTSMLAISASQSFADTTLNILHINDWHSRIESINKYDSTCSADDESEGKCFGGAARLVTAAREAKAAMGEDKTIFLNAGDNFQGSLFYSTYKGAVEAEFLSDMGTDVMTIGNHEFDDGEPGLVTFLEKVSFPVISANVLPGYKSELTGKIKPSIIVDKAGTKIGIVGAVANDTDELSSPGDGVLIAQDIATIKDEVKALRKQGINKIIALTHVGYPRDLAAIAKIRGIDVVVGGHSHTYLANDDEKAEGPYPTMVKNDDGYMVPVVQAKAYSKYLGKLSVTFNDAGIVTNAEGGPMLLDASVKPDEATVTRVKELAAPIEELKAKIVAKSNGAIDGSRETCRSQECPMGNLVTDAILDRVKDQGIQIAIQNGGGLRASIDEGDVTMGEVVTVLPFQNTLATFQLKGADVIAALENGVSQIEDGAGRFPQVAGLKYSFDPSKPAGERISDVMVAEGDGFVALDPEATYGVASNNFMRAGGDGYKVFATNADNAYDYGPGLEQVLADYLARNTPYEPKADEGRITRIAMTKQAMEEPSAEEEKPAEAVPATEVKIPERTGMKMEMPATGPKVESPEAKMEKAEAAPEADVKVPPRMGMKMEMPSAGPKVETEAAPEKVEMKGTVEEKSSEAMTKEEPKAEAMTKEEPKAEAMTKEEPKAEAMKDESKMNADVKKHTVKAGDNFWDLARTYLGDATMWEKIADQNPEAKVHGLQIGEELVIPSSN